MRSSISTLTLPCLNFQCKKKNTIMQSCHKTLCFYSNICYFAECPEIMALIEKRCVGGWAGAVILNLWKMDTLWRGAFKTDMSAGKKKTSLLLWGAKCRNSSILFIAMWMFLLTAHLCADWAIKILSFGSEWTGSHIQGHYALGVRKIKHQITARLRFFSLEMEQFSGTSTVMHCNVWISTVISALIRKTSMATV